MCARIDYAMHKLFAVETIQSSEIKYSLFFFNFFNILINPSV